MTERRSAKVGVSIVTVALNAAAALPLTLESIIAQDYADKEIILCDGGSWDASSEVIRRYAPAIDHIASSEDAGIYYAMNDAVDHVSKDYVIFMNAGDQFFSPRAISRMVGALEGAPDIFYGNHVYVDRGLELFKRSAPFDLLATRLAEGRIDGTWLDRIPCHQATFVRTELLRSLRFDTRLRISADHDFLFRAHAAGARSQYIDEIVCHYFGGGFSVAAGERTRLEGTSIYRRFSDRPDLVDRFFYPEGSPLAPQTRRTGVKLAGFLPPEGWVSLELSGGGDWVAAEGAELLAPERESGGLELSGYNELEEQGVRLLLGDETVAEAVVPRNFFRLEMAFNQTVPPSAVVKMVPTQTQTLGDRRQASVGFALRSFRFADAEARFSPGMAAGERLKFQSSTREHIAPLLGRGWAEPEATHIWSIGEQSDLWLKLSPDCTDLKIAIGGNPHVLHGEQRLALRVNGEQVAEAPLDHGGRATLEVECCRAPWLTGAVNHLALVPSATAVPPPETGDRRQLGFCLWELEASAAM